MKVFKFGGASISDSNAIRNMVDIIQNHQGGLLIVVSAMGKGTNALEEILGLEQQDQDYQQAVDRYLQYHTKICEKLLGSSDQDVFQKLTSLSDQLCENLAKEYDNEGQKYDQVISFGELFSTTVVHAFLEKSGLVCAHLDSRELIVTDSTFKEGRILWDRTKESILDHIDLNFEGCYLAQGFIGADQDGNTLTLGREGSDFTAAIFASCLDAESVTIWKDVPGILNADPDMWEETIKYDDLSYGEAAEMTYYGAKVIHPKTIRPLAVKKIPLLVKSFFDPTAEGTRIHDIQHDVLAPAIIFKKNQCLISFQARDLTYINENQISLIIQLIENFNIKVNMMQCSAISFSVCVDSPDQKLKSLINDLHEEFDIHYNDHLELITIKNYDPELINEIKAGKNILLEQKTRKNCQILVTN